MLIWASEASVKKHEPEVSTDLHMYFDKSGRLILFYL